MAKLTWTVEPEGWSFSVFDGNEFQPWPRWGAQSLIGEGGRTLSVGPLLGLFERLDVPEHVRDVVVPHEAVASLPDEALVQLGLPPRWPNHLLLTARGQVTDPGFRVTATFLNNKGHPLAGVAQSGALITQGNRRYVLPESELRILTRLARLETLDAAKPDERIVAWGEVRRLLEPGIGRDRYIDGFRVRRVNQLGLEPVIDERGEVTVVPKLIRRADRTENWDETQSSEELTLTQQDDFQRQFARKKAVPNHYVLGDGTVVIVEPPVRDALALVQRVRSEPRGVRELFVSNPRVYLREAFGDALGEERLDALFEDAGYGERVQEVAPWVPRAAERRGSGTQWVPQQPVPEPVIPIEAIERASDQVSPGPGQTVRAAKVFDNVDQVGFVAKARAPSPQRSPHVPLAVRSRLHSHQIGALGWLQDHWSAGSPGALLADDMGLGKTLSTLAFMAWVRDRMESGKDVGGPILVVAPTGLLHNWKKEHDLHLNSPGLGRLVCAFGEDLKGLRLRAGSGELRHGLPELDRQSLSGADWVLATYETVRDYQHSFATVRWAVVVGDEIQKIKNPASQSSNAFKALQSRFTIALTGTPVENRLADLWTIVDAVRPGSLGSLRDFNARYDPTPPKGAPPPPPDPTRLKPLHESLLVEGTPTPAKRRMKEDHLEALPEKRANLLRAEMPREQAAKYLEVVSIAQHSPRTPANVLQAIHNLRKVSLHPAVLDSAPGDDAYLGRSARLRPCVEVLDRIRASGEKALIFTDSLAMQGELAGLLQRRFGLRRPPMLINGEVAGAERQRRVDTFQGEQGFDVMILSPKAGGVGLTLTAANHVIHLSRWWNPAVEDQATDRVYRIGQTKPVTVHLPMAIHPVLGDQSFDVLLHGLLERKRALSRSVLAPTGETEGDLKELFEAAIARRDGS
ncbi:MAG: DEAD/DEAH box helicase [Deltaproteobacteria bacterium]|nr:DEAD/DEAH box helicase [Deltaproteobacteria bacterium]